MDTSELHPDFKELLNMLNENGVEYLLVDAYAVGYYGLIRSTGDLDIWVPPDAANADKLVSVLRDFGAPADETTRRLLTQEDSLVNMGVEPVLVQFMTSASGLNFQDCFARREWGEIDEVYANVICLEDLKKNKEASGRLKDLAHLEKLRKLRKKRDR